MPEVRICALYNNGGVLTEREIRVGVRDVPVFPASSWKDDVGSSFQKGVNEAAHELSEAVESFSSGIESLGFSLDTGKASYDQGQTRSYIASLSPRRG